MFDYIVVGAGLAGSVVAERIANVLDKKVLLIEKRKHIGGNCYDFMIGDGILVHKYGPHIFHTNYKEVWNYLSNFTDWLAYQHKVLAFVDGKKVPIPFNLNTLYMVFPETIAKRIEYKLLEKFPYNSRVSILKLRKENDEDLRFLANYIYENIFLHYTSKQWELKPEEIDESVLERVPVVIGKDDRYFNDKYQGLPLEGYTKMFERMLFHPNIKLLLNTDFREVLKVDWQDKEIYFLGVRFEGKVVFTGMIDELFDYKFGMLPYRSLYLKLETLRTTYFQEAAVVNYPNSYDFTRITEFKYFYKYKLDIPLTVILKEFPCSYSYGKNTPFYPIITKNSEEIYLRYRDLAKDFDNIVLLGRLADYRYYDMDDVVKRALDVFEEKIR